MLLGADAEGVSLACAVGSQAAKGCGDGRQCGKQWSALGVLHLLSIANARYCKQGEIREVKGDGFCMF